MNINNGATAVLLSSSSKTSNRNFKHSLSTLTLEIDVCVDFVVQIFEKLPAMICGTTSRLVYNFYLYMTSPVTS